MDEPVLRGKTAEEQQRIYDELKNRIAWVHENHPDVLAFAILSIGKIDLNRYIETSKPDVFCYDYYLLRRDGTTANHYLHWVNVGREAARKHRLPYWMVLQSYGREAEEDEGPAYAKRIPDEADMRFLAFSLLAHGGIGMQFFIYYTDTAWETPVTPRVVAGRELPESQRNVYEDSVMTRTYFALRAMAPEVQTLGRAVLNLRTKDEIGYAGVLPHEKLKRFKGHGALKSIEVVGEPEAMVLVGLFDDAKGQEYFMVVNLVHGANMSKMDGARMIRLTFDSRVEQIERLNRLTGLVEVLRTKPAEEGDARVLDIQLEGGTGDLLKWSNGDTWDLRPAP